MSSDAEYRVDFAASAIGTSMWGTISVAPSLLVSVFGAPALEDGDVEGLGSYIFAGPAGKVGTVYMRANDVPREEILAMQPSFWTSNEPEDFHVGANSKTDADLFAQWLVSRVDGASPNHSSKRAKWISTEMFLSSFMKASPEQGSGE